MILDNIKLNEVVEKLGINFPGLKYDVKFGFNGNFQFGATTDHYLEPSLGFFIHDLSHLVEYSKNEFRTRSLKSGNLLFKTPWNKHLNCSMGFSKLGPSLREARTIAIEIHLLEFIGIKINLEEYTMKEAKPIVSFVGDSLFLPGKTELEKIRELQKIIISEYFRLDQCMILYKLRQRMKAISLYSEYYN